MKRLAIVDYLRSAGGIERVLRGLARALLEIPEAADWDITLLLGRHDSAHRPAPWPAELTGPRLRVEWLGPETGAAPWLDGVAHGHGLGIGDLAAVRLAAMAGARLVRQVGPMAWRRWLGDPGALLGAASGRFDLLYVPYPFEITAPRLDCAVVATPADFNFKHFLPARSLARLVQERAVRSWMDRADRLIFYGEAMLGELRTFYPEHLPKSEAVHLGLEVVGPPPTADAIARLKRERGLPDRFALVTGWVAPHKNQLAVVDAAVALGRRGHQLPIVFAGPNAGQLGEPPTPGHRAPYVEAVRARLRAAGLQAGRDFHVLGFVSDADIQALYRLATVFLLPSRYEGFGLSGLEAMLARCPVVLSEIPPLLEQLQLLGDVALTFPPDEPLALADRIERTLGDPRATATRVALAAARVPEAFDWRKTARAYLQAFDVVLAARRTGR